jgi:hypothetical protein
MPDQDPANPQPFMRFPSEAVRQRLDARLKSLPIQDAIRQSLGKELGKVLNAETLNTTFRDLVTGRTSLDQSLQQLATTASQVLDTVMQAEQQRSSQETRINQELQAALQQDKVSRDRKNYVVQGKVMNERTQEPLARLLVQATDQDDFLGLAITDQEGRFEIDFDPKDFQEGSENPLKVMLQVGVDLQTPLYKIDSPLVVRPNEPTSTSIILPADQSEIAQHLIAQNQQSFGDQLQTATRSIANTQYQHIQAQAIGNALKTELTQFLNKPESDIDSTKF